MGMRVAESLAAVIHVKLLRTNGEIIFQDTGQHAGLEVAGDIEKLLSSRLNKPKQGSNSIHRDRKTNCN